MKNKIKKTILVSITLMLFFVLFTPVSAQNDYVVLTPLPGIGENAAKTTTLQTYLPQVFKLSIGIAAVLAFVMITFGGITYAVADSITGKDAGKTYIKNALWGLLLVIGAYTILYTINPQILSFNLSIKRPVIQAVVMVEARKNVLPGYALNQAQIDKNLEMRTDLKDNYQVDVKNGPCLTAERTTGCTNLVGMPGRAFNGVVSLKSICSCQVIITGGTEGGHKTHGPNLPTLDLSKDDRNLDSFIIKNAFSPVENTPKGKIYTVRLGNGQVASFLDEIGGAPHWHVNF